MLEEIHAPPNRATRARFHLTFLGRRIGCMAACSLVIAVDKSAPKLTLKGKTQEDYSDKNIFLAGADRSALRQLVGNSTSEIGSGECSEPGFPGSFESSLDWHQP